MAKNPEAKITVKMLTDDFKKGAADLKNESSTISREFKLQSEQMKLTATETEKLEAKIAFLTQKQDIAARSVQQSQQAYNEAVRLFGENSKAAQDMAKNLDNARIDEQKLKNEIELANRSLQSQHTESNQTADGVDNLGDSLVETSQDAKKMGDSMSDVGTKMSVGLTAPILAAGGALTAIAKQFDSAAADIQSSLGITKDEAEDLKNVAKNVWEDGFGESLEEVSGSLIRVKQNMKGLKDNAELEKVTKDAMLLAKTFDSDVNEITRAGNNLMTNFGIESEKAFDLMAKGAQNGLNFSNELFDNLAEYAPLWADMGYSAEEMFGILERGAENGVYNLDYINDVMKEFQILIQDGSKSTSDAMAGMLQETQDMFYAFQAGEVTVAEMSQQVAKDLATLDNRVDKNALGVAFFGTKWEDLGGDVVLSMLKSNESMKDFEGAMKGIADVQEQAFGQRFKAAFRQAQTAALPLGDVLLDLAEDWLPKVSSSIESVAEWFEDLSPEMLETIVIVGGLVAAIGPLLVVSGSLINSLGAIKLGFAATTGPVGLLVAGLGLVAAGTLAFVNYLKKDGLPNIDLFGDSVSSSTEKAVTGFMELNDKATVELNKLAWGGMTVTEEMAQSITGTFNQMGSQVLEGMKQDHADQLSELQRFFQTSDALTEEQEKEALVKLQETNAEQTKSYQENMNRINEIILTASKEKRQTSEAENIELERLRNEQMTTGIQILSDGELEFRTIMERMKAQSAEITAEQAIQTIADARKTKSDVIAEAEKQYADTVAMFVRMRDETGSITDEQAAAMIEDATRQKDEVITKANEMYSGVLEVAKVEGGKHLTENEIMLGRQIGTWDEWSIDIVKIASKTYIDANLSISRLVKDASISFGKFETDTKNKFIDTSKNVGTSIVGIKNYATSKFEEIRSSAKVKFQETKDAIWKPIDEAKSKVSETIQKIKGFFSNLTLKFPEIKMPKLPHFKMTGKFSLNPPSVPKLDVDWYRTGGVFTKPVVAGNAGFGDVTEAIVPFEGSHAARIAGLIAEQQSKLASVADTIAPPQPIYIQVVSELDGQAVANNQYKYLNGMTTSDYNIGRVVKGY